MRGSYAGVDWASEKHDVLIADEAGEEILAATFAHDEAGVRGLCRALVRHEVTLVAIGRPDGLLVERLLEAGLRILALHPNRHRALQQHITVTIPTPSGPRPDLAATQRMAGAAVTQRAARRAEREALDGKPTSAITPGG
jgi:hypothetical protein